MVRSALSRGGYRDYSYRQAIGKMATLARHRLGWLSRHAASLSFHEIRDNDLLELHRSMALVRLKRCKEERGHCDERLHQVHS